MTNKENKTETATKNKTQLVKSSNRNSSNSVNSKVSHLPLSASTSSLHSSSNIVQPSSTIDETNSNRPKPNTKNPSIKIDQHKLQEVNIKPNSSDIKESENKTVTSQSNKNKSNNKRQHSSVSDSDLSLNETDDQNKNNDGQKKVKNSPVKSHSVIANLEMSANNIDMADNSKENRQLAQTQQPNQLVNQMSQIPQNPPLKHSNEHSTHSTTSAHSTQPQQHSKQSHSYLITHSTATNNLQSKRQNFMEKFVAKKYDSSTPNTPSNRVRDPICIYLDKKHQTYLDSSPKLLQYIKDNSTAKIRSVMKDKQRALLYPETIEDAENIMDPDSNLFPGCHRRNIGTEKLSLIFVNVSQNDLSQNPLLQYTFDELNITGSSPLSKDNKDAKIIKVFFKSHKDKLFTLSNYYKFGININIEGQEMTIRVEPCIKSIPQCNRCNKLLHREENCKENAQYCSYCNKTDHSFEHCNGSRLECTNCGGSHNAYNYRECEKYKSIKRLEIKKEIENQLGLMTGSLSKSYGLTYANSVIQNVIPQNLTLSKQTNSINGTLSNEIISKIEKAIGTSVDCVRTAKESLDSAQKLLEKVEENMKAIAQRECQQVLKITLKEVDSRVSNLRSEVISWISNSNSINKTQLNMNPELNDSYFLSTANTNHNLMSSNSHYGLQNNSQQTQSLMYNHSHHQINNLNQPNNQQNHQICSQMQNQNNATIATNVPLGNTTYAVLNNVSQ